MPQIRIRGVDQQKALVGSGELLDSLAVLLASPRADFTLELVQSTFIDNGNIREGYPFVEVLWFDRGLEKQDATAKLITDFVHELGYSSVDIWFTQLQHRNYYENGSHFG